jgi:hypothetical protein
MRDLVRRLCELAAERLPVRVIEGVNGDVFLERYRVADLGPSRGRVFLHRFVRGDEDRELHNHPWHGLSLILVGGYREERRVWTPEGERVVQRDLKPGNFNLIAPHTFHRVDLARGECWTLFVAGPVVQSWGFWCRDTNTFTPWREFIARKGMVPRG